MMCQQCGQREANICFATVINGEKHEQYLCSECAAKKQLLKFDLSQLAGQLLRKPENAPTANDILPENTPAPELCCARCGLSYAEYARSGQLGCPDCYDAFREPLGEYLKRKLNHTRYAGHLPNESDEKVSLNMRRDKLKQQLHRAIEEEDYERAAGLRDQIRLINARLQEEAAHE